MTKPMPQPRQPTPERPYVFDVTERRVIPDSPYLGSAFRRRAGDRESIPSCGERSAHYRSSSAVGIGAITSRPKNTWSFYQVLAFELAGAGDPSKAIVPFCTAAQAERLHSEGLVK